MSRRGDYSLVLDGAVLHGCDAIGIMGGCGMDCDYFLEMDCPNVESVLDGLVKDYGGVLYVFDNFEEEM